MMRDHHFDSLATELVHKIHSQDQLKKDIAYFEARLEELGQSGDCAYEKAMVRVYDSMLEDRRRILAQLQTA